MGRVECSGELAYQLGKLGSEIDYQGAVIRSKIYASKICSNSTKCHHLVLDECSLTGKNCKGLQECFKEAEGKLKRIYDIVKKETETRMLFADKNSYFDFCTIAEIIEEKTNGR